MIRYFLLAVAMLLALAVAISMFAKADPRKLAKALRLAGGGVLMAIALALMTRGLFVYALPLAFLAYSVFTGRMFRSSSWPGSASKSAGQQSQVRTGTIEMRLDHDTGDMEGRVIKGRYENRMLSDMSLEELLDLLTACQRRDGQAAQLLQAYLDRHHPQWREAASEAQADDTARPDHSVMNTEEAYEILGLAPGATAAEIRKAHRTLMKKLHPDQGGSNYLASKINEAKDLLLGRNP